jgi:uncharacterized repeat protein (TIGR03803 family)
MWSNSLAAITRRFLSAVIILCAFSGVVCAQTDTTLFNFAYNGSSGGGPIGPLAFDSEGNLYGVTIEGGANCIPFGCGTVFKLAHTSTGWQQTQLYTNFVGGITASPNGGLVFDSAGNIYGTSNLNSVWKLSPASQGQWNLTLLHQFAPDSADGNGPTTGVVLDAQGNIYGTTKEGGTGKSPECSGSGCGTVFELSPGPDGQYTYTILYNFQGGIVGDGSWPRGVILDTQGNLYGVTQTGGFGQGQSICDANGCGTVYELSPTSGGQWQETQLYVFQGGDDGSWPMSTLTRDAAGTFYGTAYSGGLNNEGTIFSLENEQGQWKESAYSVSRFKGINPGPGVVTIDSAGHLFSDIPYGPPHGNGMVFELNLSDGGFKLLDAFPNRESGTSVNGGVILLKGKLFGVTEGGGQYNQGIVFEITP